MTEERIAEIEKALSDAKELGPAEEQLLIIWLEETDEPLTFEYEGGFCFDSVTMKVSPFGEVLGFEYDFNEDLTRECDERSGEFRLDLFGFSFWHNGVTQLNEHAWFEAEWGESPALEEALNERVKGNLPHIEEYSHMITLTEGCVRKAFKWYADAIDSEDLRYFKSPDGKVFVYALGVNQGPDIRDRALDLVLIDENEAAELLSKSNLPFDYCDA